METLESIVKKAEDDKVIDTLVLKFVNGKWRGLAIKHQSALSELNTVYEYGFISLSPLDAVKNAIEIASKCGNADKKRKNK